MTAATVKRKGKSRRIEAERVDAILLGDPAVKKKVKLGCYECRWYIRTFEESREYKTDIRDKTYPFPRCEVSSFVVSLFYPWVSGERVREVYSKETKRCIGFEEKENTKHG